MPRWFQIVLAVVLYTAVMAGVAQRAQAFEEGAIYRCSAVQIHSLQEDGTLSARPNDSPLFRAFQNILVDTSSGVIRLGQSPQEWKVAQRGGPQEDFVAVAGSSPSVSTEDYIRIRQWKGMSRATFFLVGLTMVTTGFCDPVR